MPTINKEKRREKGKDAQLVARGLIDVCSQVMHENSHQGIEVKWEDNMLGLNQP